MKLLVQSHVLPPRRYIRPSTPTAAAASAVAAGSDGKEFQGGEEVLNCCDRSRDRKSLEREVSERIPPRM